MCMVCDNTEKLKSGTHEERTSAKSFFVDLIVVGIVGAVVGDPKLSGVLAMASTTGSEEDSKEILSRVADELRERLLATAKLTRRIEAGDAFPPLPEARGTH